MDNAFHHYIFLQTPLFFVNLSTVPLCFPTIFTLSSFTSSIVYMMSKIEK